MGAARVTSDGEGKKTTLEVSAAFFPDMYQKHLTLFSQKCTASLRILKRRLRGINKNKDGVLLWEAARVLASQS